MRVFVYVDGFNLYYRALKDSKLKWINLSLLAQRVLDPTDTIELIRYFTARVSPRAGNPDGPRRQQILFSALATLPNIAFHYGSFLAKRKWRPLASDPSKFVQVLDTEEKGSDVNLAVHLLNDAWHKRFELALILSQDTDLIEPLRIVTGELKMLAGLVWLDGGRPNKHLAAAASFVRHIKPSDLAAAQFPDPVVKADGTEIHKPLTW